MAETVRLTRFDDVVWAAQQPQIFASRTSGHLHVPNGMDGRQHRAFRAIVDRQMTPQIVADLQPMLDDTAAEVVGQLPLGAAFDAVGDLGEVFAVRAQCRWLGWPAALEDELREWMAENYAAARRHDPERNAAVAAAFDAIVSRQIAAHRAARESGQYSSDATHRLLDEQVDGRPLTDEELVSILRNWTAGDLGSLARCVGVVVHRLAARPRWQRRMRMLARSILRGESDPRPEDESSGEGYSSGDDGAPVENDPVDEFDAILGECLRLDDPFVANRRIATCPATAPSGEEIDEGAIVLLDWVAANRDPDAFSEGFRPHEHAERNIVFGIGPHVCPGRGLSYAELRAIIAALLDVASMIEPAAGQHPARHEPPIGGWATVPIVLS